MDDQEFKQLVQAGLDAIAKPFIDRLDNVAIVIEDEPSPALRQDLNLGSRDLLFGLYQGVPQTSRGAGYNLVLPDKITIFKKPILKNTNSEEEIKELVAETVWHEIAHHFGLDEAEVRYREANRHKNK